jgi:HD-like signal output (HDOD) protein
MREEFFVAGILHDLGKIVLSGCFPEDFDLACKKTCNGRGSLHVIENVIFGLDHGLV